MKRSPLPIRTQDADTLRKALQLKPGSTASELFRTTGIPSVTRVISAMIDEYKYEFAKGWKKVKRKGGGGTRRVRTYFIVSCPSRSQLNLPGLE